MEDDLQIAFKAVVIGDVTYAVVSKQDYEIEELEKSWVIKMKEKPLTQGDYNE